MPDRLVYLINNSIINAVSLLVLLRSLLSGFNPSSPRPGHRMLSPRAGGGLCVCAAVSVETGSKSERTPTFSRRRRARHECRRPGTKRMRIARSSTHDSICAIGTYGSWFSPSVPSVRPSVRLYIQVAGTLVRPRVEK